MWPLPVIERARRQDSKIGAPSPSCGVVGAGLGGRVPRQVSQLEDRQDLLIGEEAWEAIGNPNVVDYIAHRLFVLKETIDGTPGGAQAAREIIQASIEAAYLHTAAHKSALRLYLLSLTGRLKPQDEPVRLIRGAIERGAAQDETLEKGRARKKSGG